MSTFEIHCLIRRFWDHKWDKWLILKDQGWKMELNHYLLCLLLREVHLQNINSLYYLQSEFLKELDQQSRNKVWLFLKIQCLLVGRSKRWQMLLTICSRIRFLSTKTKRNTIFLIKLKAIIMCGVSVSTNIMILKTRIMSKYFKMKLRKIVLLKILIYTHFKDLRYQELKIDLLKLKIWKIQEF